MVNLELINKRLGLDFIDLVKKHYENIDSEYDGKRPIDYLNEDEKEFYYNYLSNKLKCKIIEKSEEIITFEVVDD